MRTPAPAVGDPAPRHAIHEPHSWHPQTNAAANPTHLRKPRTPRHRREPHPMRKRASTIVQGVRHLGEREGAPRARAERSVSGVVLQALQVVVQLPHPANVAAWTLRSTTAYSARSYVFLTPFQQVRAVWTPPDGQRHEARRRVREDRGSLRPRPPGGGRGGWYR